MVDSFHGDKELPSETPRAMGICWTFSTCGWTPEQQEEANREDRLKETDGGKGWKRKELKQKMTKRQENN